MTDKIEIKEASVWEWSKLDRCAWSTGSSRTVAHERDIPGHITGEDRKKLAAFVRYRRDLDGGEWRDPDGNMWEFRRNPETGAPEASIAGGNYWTPFPDETDFFGPGGALSVWAERNPAPGAPAIDWEARRWELFQRLAVGACARWMNPEAECCYDEALRDVRRFCDIAMATYREVER